MATMYAPGGRRSAAPIVSPRAALSTEALYDDQVTKNLINAMLSATQPAGVGQSQAGINIGEALGTGTYIDNMFAGGGESAGNAPSSGTGSVSAGLAAMGGLASGLSAIGVIGQNADIAQAAQSLGQVATIGSAVDSAVQGNIGQAAMTAAPMAANALGIPGLVVGPALTALNPTLGPVDVQASLVNSAIAAISPVTAAALGLGQMLGFVPSTKSLLTPVVNMSPITAVSSETVGDTSSAGGISGMSQGLSPSVSVSESVAVGEDGLGIGDDGGLGGTEGSGNDGGDGDGGP